MSISTAQPVPAKATDTSVPSSSTQQKSSALLIIKPTTTNSLKAIKLKKNGEARKPYTFKKKSATSSSSNTISPPSHTIDNLFKMQNSKLTNSNFKSDQIAIKQEKLDTENWLTASQIDEFVIFLSEKNSFRDERFQLINEFGGNLEIRCIYELQRMDAQGSAFNSNKDAAFVICANSNHWIVLSNINFNILKFQKENTDTAFQTDDDFNRTEWYFYDSLNDNNHASFCSKVLEKIFLDQTGCNLSRIVVQQQRSIGDCG